MHLSLEFALLLALLAVAVAAGLRPLRPLRRLKASAARLTAVLVAAAVAVTVTVLAARGHHTPTPETEILGRPVQVPHEGYVTSQKCQACHPGEYATWKGSFHSSMTQVATRQTVLGDFEDRELRLGPAVFHLSRVGDDFWVDMPDIDAPGGTGPRVQRRIALTTGSHHMQAYWYATGNTRMLGLLPFVHNVETGDWLPRGASFIVPPHDAPESEAGRWNKTCLECHVTQGRLRPIEVDGIGGNDTQVTEFGVGCESCHGPAEAHVEAYQGVVARYAAHFDEEADKHIVQPEKLTHRRSTEVCGQCHSTSVWTTQDAIDRFMEDGFAYRPGDRLADTKSVVRGRFEDNPPAVQDVLRFQPDLIPNTFWSDGMNRIAGREYNGLLESACFQRGEMSCLSCHQLHRKTDDPRADDAWKDDQLAFGMRRNDACVQCHDAYRGAAAVQEHTHHQRGSSGSNCYNCHMPHTTYGLLKAVRSHQVDSPSVAASVATGRPNACNQCHLDRTAAWTAGWLADWYGIPEPELSPTQRSVAAIPLMALQGDAGQRALAAWSLGWAPGIDVAGEHWQGLYLSVLLGDPYPAVRQIAARSLRRMPGFADFQFDPVAAPPELYRSGNAALERWTREYAASARAASEAILMDAEGARIIEILELLQGRDDRPVAFAE